MRGASHLAMEGVFLTSTEGYQPSTTSYLRVHPVAMKPLHTLHCPLKVQAWPSPAKSGSVVCLGDHTYMPLRSTINPQDTEVLFCLLGAA